MVVVEYLILFTLVGLGVAVVTLLFNLNTTAERQLSVLQDIRRHLQRIDGKDDS